MAEVRVSQEVGGKPAAIFDKVRKYCDTKLILKEVGDLKPEVEWEKKKRLGNFNEKGVKGTITVTSDPCTITITMDIPIYLAPFKSVLKKSIQKHLANFC